MPFFWEATCPIARNQVVSARVKLFLPILRMNLPEIVEIALPTEGVVHNLLVGA